MLPARASQQSYKDWVYQESTNELFLIPFTNPTNYFPETHLNISGLERKREFTGSAH